MTVSELLPCPFCGSTNVAQGASRDRISVWCFCGAQGPSVPFPEINPEPIKAIHECFAAWNRRSSSRRVVNALEEAIRDFMPLAQVAFLWTKETPPEDEVTRYRDTYNNVLCTLAIEQEQAEPGEVEEKWRDLALQFDGHRIEALSMIRYAIRHIEEYATVRDILREPLSELKLFLHRPPLSGEKVLAARIYPPSPPEIDEGQNER
jgi:hypothetical protein